jgi:hypothetical protein
MKNLLLFILLFAWGSIDRSFVDDPREGLVAHYTFNACDARDDSGNGNHGQLFGNVSCWCGVEGDGLLLDGEQDYLEFHGIVNRYFTTSDFTISFYFKPERGGALPQSLLSKREACVDFSMLDILLHHADKEVDARLYEAPYRYFPGLNTPLDAEGWRHFALVREGLKASTYINGRLRKESMRCSDMDIGNEAILSFSNSPCVREGKARRFRGVIDELRVYGRALSEGEIFSLYRLTPIENAYMDCFAFLPESMPAKGQIPYLCLNSTP